jgi:hypothetical protein
MARAEHLLGNPEGNPSKTRLGTAELTLSNLVKHTFSVRGRTAAKSPAVLTLAGDSRCYLLASGRYAAPAGLNLVLDAIPRALPHRREHGTAYEPKG